MKIFLRQINQSMLLASDFFKQMYFAKLDQNSIAPEMQFEFGVLAHVAACPWGRLHQVFVLPSLSYIKHKPLPQCT